MDIDTRLQPRSNLTSSTKSHRGIINGALAALAIIAAPAGQGATFTTLYSFCAVSGCPDGMDASALIQATNGDLYGTTASGGANGDFGTIFRITTSGKLTTLHSFDGPDGDDPEAGLVQATNRGFYGTTSDLGPKGFGTIFELEPNGNLVTLYSFDATYNPQASLVQATNGGLYGTTEASGDSGDGTVFEITPSGAQTTLDTFAGGDGAEPMAGLIQATNGQLYGTTFNGGTQGEGTVFLITPSGTLSTVYNFCSQVSCADGAEPAAALIQAADGNLYGTTSGGGNAGDGTVFKITLGGALTVIYNFCSQANCTDGETPYAGLIQATDGNLYGTTNAGGTNGAGTIFSISPGGTLTTLYNFCSQTNCADGTEPRSALLQDTNGDFYGTAGGGANGAGTIFSLSVGLGPFVETQTRSGKVGAAVKILGSDLTGATSVTFNGTAATFTVASKSEITTNVPTGATTGTVEVQTPGGTLKSNASFVVKP